MENKVRISVVSYKRPNNNTCNLLLNSSIKDWSVYVYQFDPMIEEYLKNYDDHVRIITEFDKPSLPKKRQLVLDEAIKLNYDYCIMMDDDIFQITDLRKNEDISIEEMIKTLYETLSNNEQYVALSACYNKNDDGSIEISNYKNVCNNSIFNLKLYRDSKVVYNPESKCEDMEFTLDLIIKGFLTGRLDFLLCRNTLQGGTTDDGLSYRFSKTNRYIEEGSYMEKRYPNLDIFEYDENHFKMNTAKLIEYVNKGE